METRESDHRRRVVAVIPARGGSKGIPRKNMRLMVGKPLISYAIENALASEYIDDVVVSSDSEEILAYAGQFDGVTALRRDTKLSLDAVTLDPVVYDAVVRREKQIGTTFDVVVTLQPTSPLLTRTTLDGALEKFVKSELNTCLSVVNAPHLSWKKDEKGGVIPAYEERLNRQQLPANYLETGAFLISDRKSVSSLTRLGESVGVFEVPEEESTDIDSIKDWIVCEAQLSRKKIAFRVDGYREIGLGHVYRALTLGYELMGHDIVYLCDEKHREGVEKLKGAFVNVVELKSDDDLFAWLEQNTPDVFVNDLLDTEVDYVRNVKQYVKRFVSFEDLGPGAREADAVINALYENGVSCPNAYTGRDYVCLRDEFLGVRQEPFRSNAHRILVTFGGTDPLNLAARIYDLALEVNKFEKRFSFDFIVGPGYSGPTLVSVPEKGIEVNPNVTRVSDHMREADIAFCSQGRTTFELACMGVPAIVIAQNERETLHSFAQMDNGFINLGLGSRVSDDDILSTFEWLTKVPTVRMGMRNLMLQNDLASGVRRVKQIILGEML